MEYETSLRPYLQEGINVITTELLNSRSNRSMLHETISLLIDELGMWSSRAQGKLRPCTSVVNIRKSGTDERMFIDYDYKRDRVNGFVRFGERNIPQGKGEFLNCFCLLDFWVHNSVERRGVGQKLFNYALQSVGKTPNELAYPSFSNKLEAFLATKYGLKAPRQIGGFFFFQADVLDSPTDIHSGVPSSISSGKNSPDSAASISGSSVENHGHHSRLHDTSSDNTLNHIDDQVSTHAAKRPIDPRSGVKNQHYYSSITF